LYGCFLNLVVVTQPYDTYGDQEHIIRGNSAILKCRIPSFVADFLDVVAWVDNDGNSYSGESKQYGISSRNFLKIKQIEE
jgi:hypothetical protein